MEDVSRASRIQVNSKELSQYELPQYAQLLHNCYTDEYTKTEVEAQY